MIDFIICDDNKEFTIMLRKKILDFMKEHKEIEYDLHSFYGYGKSFEDVVQSPSTFKVYFLDIETKKGSGLDAARLIREKYDDWNSIIIIVTTHEEFRYKALGDRLYLFDFLNKLNEFDKLLNEDLNNILKTYNKNSKSIVVEYDHEIHKIELRDIIYIEKQIDSKKCIIKTINGTIYVQSSLNDIYNNLDSNFMKVSRSLIDNIKKIKSYDSKENIIYFVNNLTSTLVSREYKKELKEYVRANN